MQSEILYVTHRVPWPPDRGDRIRTWNILKHLAKSATVDLICLADEPVTQDTRDALARVTRRLAIIPHAGKKRYIRGALSLAMGRTVTEGLFECRNLSLTVRQWAQQSNYNGAMASSSGIAKYVMPPILQDVSKVWIDLIDVDSQKWIDYAASASVPMSVVYGTEGRRLRKLEQHLAETCDRLLVVSEAERQLFHDFCPTGPIQAIGNGVDTDYFVPADRKVTPRSCVFVGVLDYLPNSDAVKWFSQHIWSEVRKKFPDAVFRIVGKNPTPEVMALNDIPGIEVVGPVPDVRPWLHKSACVVVPLRIARGVQNKVLEAMACGRALVCSSSPLKGLAVEPGLHLLQADTVAEWVDALTTVFEDKYRTEELGMAASAWVQINHRWKACLEPLGELTLVDTEASSNELEVES